MRLIPSIFVLALTAMITSSQTQAADYSGKVAVIDGHTLKFGKTEVVLWSLNAPLPDEKCLSTRGKEFPCGKTAYRTLSMLIQGRSIDCNVQDGRRDKLNRPLVVCYLQRMDINNQMVLSGWAVVMPNEGERYSRSQHAAKKTRSGMWRSLRFSPDDFKGRK